MRDSYLKPVRMRDFDFDDVGGSRLGVLNSQNGYFDEFRGKVVIIDGDGMLELTEDWTNNVD